MKNLAITLMVIITIIAMVGMVKVMNTENTGMVSKAQKQPYSGYGLVYSEAACNAIHCRIGDAMPVGVDERGHIVCQCREDPEWLQYRVTPFRNY